jgi:hypothetical protein
MPTCAVANCPINGRNYKKHEGVSFIRFPADSKEANKWWMVCKRKDRNYPTNCAKICSLHFEKECFKRDLRNELLNKKQLKVLIKGCQPTLQLPKLGASL